VGPQQTEDITLLRRASLLTAALIVVAGCGSDNATGANASGSLSFSYTGGTGTSFNASGALANNSSLATALASTWAAAYKDNSDNTTNVAGNVAHGSTSDFATITIPAQATGSYPINASCAAAACAGIELDLGVTSSLQVEWFCTLETGTIVVTSISSSSVQGTFSGTGTCDQTASPFGTTAWTVTNGSFSTPLITSPPSL